MEFLEVASHLEDDLESVPDDLSHSEIMELNSGDPKDATPNNLQLVAKPTSTLDEARALLEEIKYG